MAVPLLLFSEMASMIGALYGIQSTLGGVVGHMAISLLFAGAYAEVTSYGWFKRYTLNYRTAAVLGLVWGTILYVSAAGVVMPLWMQAVGITRFSVPVVNGLFLAGHLSYGLTLGLTFAALRRRH